MPAGKGFSWHGLFFPRKTGASLRRSFPEPVFPVIGNFWEGPAGFWALPKNRGKPGKGLGMEEAFPRPGFCSSSFSLSFSIYLFSLVLGIFAAVQAQLEPSQGALSQEEASLSALSRSLSALSPSLSTFSRAELSRENPATSAFSPFLISVLLRWSQLLSAFSRPRERYPGRSRPHLRFPSSLSAFSRSLSVFSRPYQRSPGAPAPPLSSLALCREEQSWERSNPSNPVFLFLFLD